MKLHKQNSSHLAQVDDVLLLGLRVNLDDTKRSTYTKIAIQNIDSKDDRV